MGAVLFAFAGVGLLAALGAAGWGIAGAMVGALMALLPWGIAALTVSRAMLGEFRATGDALPPGLVKTLERVRETTRKRICDALALSPSSDPDAFYFRTPGGERWIILTEGLLRRVSESELREILAVLGSRLEERALGWRSLCAVIGYWLWRAAPAEWRSVLFQGRRLPTYGHSRLGPFRFFWTLALLPWIRLLVPPSLSRGAYGEDLLNAMRKLRALRPQGSAAHPACWNGLSLFPASALASSFELAASRE